MFWTWLVRTLCWHEYVRRWEKGRLFVMCLKCGHESRRRYADSLLKMFHEDLGIKTDGQAEDIDPKYRAIYFKNEEN